MTLRPHSRGTFRRSDEMRMKDVLLGARERVFGSDGLCARPEDVNEPCGNTYPWPCRARTTTPCGAARKENSSDTIDRETAPC
jgi:hypothetical protein